MARISFLKKGFFFTEDSKPVSTRLLIPLSGIIFLLILSLSGALVLTHQKGNKRFSQHILEDATRSLELSLKRKARVLNGLEDVLLHNKQLYPALQAKDRSQLLTLFQPTFEKLKTKYEISHFYFHLPDRTNLVRIHKPSVYGDFIDRHTARTAERTNKAASGIELGPLGTFTLRVVQPVYFNSTLIGYLELGQEIEGMLTMIEQRLGVDLAVTIHKHALNRQKWEVGMEMLGREANWNRYQEEVLIYYSLPHFPKEADHLVHGYSGHHHETLTEDISFADKKWRLFTSSLHDVSGTEVGDLLIFLDVTEAKAAFSRLVISTIALACLLLVGLFSFLYLILHRMDQSLASQQAQLIESEERQRALLDAISRTGIYLFVVDSAYNIRYMNSAMKEAFGDEMGNICYNRIAGYNSPCSHCRLREVIDHQQTVFYNATLASKRTFIMIAVPYTDLDGTPCKLEVMQDVTEQLQIEKEKKGLEEKLQRAQKMEALGLLAGGVAHDLNNILSGIVSYPELMLINLPEKSKLREPLVAIRESGTRAAAVVEDLLTVARGVARAKDLFDVNVLIQEYVKSPEATKLQTLYPDVTITCTLEASQAYIYCSPVHIKKSLMNLVTNAAEAIGSKGTITISTHNRHLDQKDGAAADLPEGEYILLTVEDSGSGISKEALDHIFEPFYTKKVMGRSGTGLGLTVVHNTVEEHDGKIFVESSAKGTTFTLYFPLSHGVKQQIQQKAVPEALPPKGEHILIIDDESQLRDIASQILKNQGYTVDSVCSGEMAIRFIVKQPVDLILIDMLMEPGMNGREAYEEILQINPEQKAVIASGFSESDDVKATLKLGASGFIKKPYSMDQLCQVVQEALQD